MSEPRETILIKRYASRRLYNTATSEYVTLDQIAAYIRDGNDVEIVDRKTGDDITRQYLLQIITEHESRGENLLPLNILTDVVRSYSDQAQSVIPDFLSQSFDYLKKQQAEIMDTFGKSLPDAINPASAFENLGEWQKKQSELFGSLFSPWMPGFGGDAGGPSDARPAPGPEQNSDVGQSSGARQHDDKDAEIAEMKKQLASMAEKLKNM